MSTRGLMGENLYLVALGFHCKSLLLRRSLRSQRFHALQRY